MSNIDRLYKIAKRFGQDLPAYQRTNTLINPNYNRKPVAAGYGQDATPQIPPVRGVSQWDNGAAAITSDFAKDQSQSVPRQKEVPRNAPMFEQTVVNDEQPQSTSQSLYPVNKQASMPKLAWDIAATAPARWVNRNIVEPVERVYQKPNVLDRFYQKPSPRTMGVSMDEDGNAYAPAPQPWQIADARIDRLFFKKGVRDDDLFKWINENPYKPTSEYVSPQEMHRRERDRLLAERREAARKSPNPTFRDLGSAADHIRGARNNFNEFFDRLDRLKVPERVAKMGDQLQEIGAKVHDINNQFNLAAAQLPKFPLTPLVTPPKPTGNTGYRVGVEHPEDQFDVQLKGLSHRLNNFSTNNRSNHGPSLLRTIFMR